MTTQLQAKFIVLISILILAGCNNTPKKADSNKVTFDSIKVDRSYHLLDNPENPNCNLQINFTYPTQVDNKQQIKDIQRIFIQSYFGDSYVDYSPKEAAEKYTEDYLTNYKALEADFKSEADKAQDEPIGAWYSYYEMSSNKITYNKSGLLCFTVNFENYTGGAHGSHSYFNHIINLKTGSAVTEKEVFIDNYEDDLAKILVDAIAKQNQVTDVKALENMGFFSVDEIFPNGNFSVDETGINYTFNEYEIAAYVVGVTNVHLPFGEIQHLLRKESPIAHLAF